MENNVTTTGRVSYPSKTFANPFIACTTCNVRVYWWTPEGGNDPCGHNGRNQQVGVVSVGKRVTWDEHTEPWRSVCPSWGPVDGCTCPPHTHAVPTALSSIPIKDSD